MNGPPHSVRMVWHSDRHSPHWELQTEHAGFENWIEPALFANGFIEPHPWLIKLTKGRLTIALASGGSLVLAGRSPMRPGRPPARWSGHDIADWRRTPGLGQIQLSAWCLDPEDCERIDYDDAMVVTCGAYRELPRATPTGLSRLGLDGLWWPQGYQVIGPDGDIPVTIEADETGQVLTVMRDDDNAPKEEADTAAIAIIMKT